MHPSVLTCTTLAGYPLGALSHTQGCPAEGEEVSVTVYAELGKRSVSSLSKEAAARREPGQGKKRPQAISLEPCSMSPGRQRRPSRTQLRDRFPTPEVSLLRASRGIASRAMASELLHADPCGYRKHRSSLAPSQGAGRKKLGPARGGDLKRRVPLLLCRGQASRKVIRAGGPRRKGD